MTKPVRSGPVNIATAFVVVTVRDVPLGTICCAAAGPDASRTAGKMKNATDARRRCRGVE